MDKNSIPKEILEPLLAPGYTDFETGVKILPTGETLLANLVPAPLLTGPMFNWWFDEFLADTSQYKIWHRDHRTMHVDRVKEGTIIGSAHCSSEELGGVEVPMRIQFFDPMEIFTKEQFEEAGISGGVTAEITSEGEKLGIVIHLIRDTFYGADIRTRLILEMGGMELGLNTNKHNIQEMIELSTFLPNLYRMYNID